MLPPTSGRGIPGYPASSSAAAAYNNAYTNTLSVAASQAASLGIPAASKAIIRKKVNFNSKLRKYKVSIGSRGAISLLKGDISPLKRLSMDYFNT